MSGLPTNREDTGLSSDYCVRYRAVFLDFVLDCGRPFIGLGWKHFEWTFWIRAVDANRLRAFGRQILLRGILAPTSSCDAKDEQDNRDARFHIDLDTAQRQKIWPISSEKHEVLVTG